jgi:hypothetical protein
MFVLMQLNGGVLYAKSIANFDSCIFRHTDSFAKPSRVSQALEWNRCMSVARVVLSLGQLSHNHHKFACALPVHR